MKTLSQRLFDLASGEYFDGAALREAYESELLSDCEKRVLSRYMHGSELRSDWFSIQDIAIKLNQDRKPCFFDEMLGNPLQSLNNLTIRG